MLCSSLDPAPGRERLPLPAAPAGAQNSPGMTPEVFLPGIVSTGLNEAGVTFSADGTECLFTVTLNRIETICVTRNVGGSWTPPEVATFSGRWSDGFPCFQPGGARLFFHSNRPLPNGAKYNIWFVDRTAAGWSEPQPVGSPVNGVQIAVCPSVTRAGTLYFSRQFDDGRELIFRSRFLGGRHLEPEELPAAVNTQKVQYHAAIAPDEHCMVMPLSGRSDAIGAGYNVAFRDERDQWSEWINLGKEINGLSIGGIASFSPDRKAFFFSAFPPADTTPSYDRTVSYAELQSLSIKNPAQYKWDVFWVDAQVIEKLRPKGKG
jgi:hypothetical protein